jgi:alkylation response protein AidB-like acyl-CoA dehydrogenase
MPGWDWSTEQSELRSSVSAWLDKACPTALVRAREPVGFDAGLQHGLGERGLLGIGLEIDSGGSGGTLTDALVVSVEVGRRLAPAPYADVVAAARMLERAGTHQQRLRRVLAGTDVITFSPVVAASRDTVMWPTALASDSIIVPQGGRLVLVPVGHSVQHVLNLGQLPMGQVPTDSGDAEVVTGLDELPAAAADWQVLFAGTLLGAARAALELGAAYARSREAFGKVIGSFQGISHPFADIAADLDGAELLTAEAAWAIDSQRERRRVLAAMSVLAAAEVAERAAAFSLHVHGGYGFTTEYDVQLYYRRCKGWRLAYVSRETLVSDVAELLLDGRDGEA